MTTSPQQFVNGFTIDPTGLQIIAQTAQVQFADLGGQISAAQLASGTPAAGQVPMFDGTQITWGIPACTTSGFTGTIGSANGD